MPHVTFVPFTGFRIREEAMRELGMSLPGLRRRGAAIAELPALGPLTLAGMLPDDWSCSYHGTPHVSDELVEVVVREQPDLVAVSALTPSVEEAYAFARRMRRENIPVVVGGLHATACPQEAVQHFDAVIVGDGEPVWPQVLRDVEAGALSPIYRSPKNGADIAWPMPRFDLLGPCPPRFTVQTQRGCPFACDFCGASRLLGRFREKPIETIRAELEAIREIDADAVIELADDNTFAGGRNVDGLLELLQDSGTRWFTETDWRIGERPDVMARLSQAGCVQVLLGIESLVFRYPGMGRKQAELERIMNSVEAIQDSGVAVNGCFIVGADGETRQSLDRLVEFILHSPLAEVQITLQTPFPGTGLYEKLKRDSRLIDRGWSYYTLFDVTYQPDCLSVAELERGFRDVVRQVFSPEATYRRNRIRHDVWKRNARLNGIHRRGVASV